MSFTLDATVGGASSNAFVDLDTAQDIVDATPNAAAAWGEDTDKQEQALAHATSLLSVLAYPGVKANLSQALPFPRYRVVDPDSGDEYELPVYLDGTTIPKRVRRACVMLAIEILRRGTADVWAEDDTVNVIRTKVDVLETEFAPAANRVTGLRALPSVWREIAPLLANTNSGSVVRA